MPLKKIKQFVDPKWKRTHPSNSSAARLQKLSDLNGDKEEEERDPDVVKMAEKPGEEPGSQPASVNELREMLTGMKDAIFQHIDEQVGKISKRVDGLVKEIAQNSNQVKSLKAEVDQLGKRVEKMEEKNCLEFDEHEKRLISLEDQSRRASVRIRNFVETRDENLRKLIPRWLKEVVPTLDIAEDEVERVHRVGFSSRPTPRDILLKFSNYFKKEQLMAQLRSLAELKFQGATVQVYNDLCQQTINWRRSVKPITTVLRKRVIKYVWGYPVFLHFMYEGTHYRVTSLQQGLELLQRLGLDPQDGDGAKDAVDGAGGAAASGK